MKTRHWVIFGQIMCIPLLLSSLAVLVCAMTLSLSPTAEEIHNLNFNFMMGCAIVCGVSVSVLLTVLTTVLKDAAGVDNLRDACLKYEKKKEELDVVIEKYNDLIKKGIV